MLWLKTRKRLAASAAFTNRLLKLAVLLGLVLLYSVGVAAQSQTYRFDIQAAPLNQAINAFIAQTDWQIGYSAKLGEGKVSPGVVGDFTAEEGLRLLLSGTGLTYERSPAGSVVTLRAEAVQRLDSGTSIQLDRVTVSSSALVNQGRDSVYFTQGSAAVITREDIDRHPPRNTADILAGAAGVFTSQSRQNPGVSVNVRGMQDFGRVTVMLDGARQNFQKSGHGSNGSAYIDPELLAGVNVFKGPVSTSGGAGSIAGTVNFRTLSADDLLKPGDKTAGRLNLNSGDNNYEFAGSLVAAARVSDTLAITAGVSRKQLGDFERGAHNRPASSPDHLHGASQFTGQEQWSSLLKTQWKPAAGEEWTLSYVGLRADFSESFLDTDMASSLRGDNQADMDTLKLGYRVNPADNPLINLDTSLYYTSTRVHEQRMNASFYDDFSVSYETHTLGGTLENTSSLRWDDVQIRLKYGGEFYRDWTDPQAQSETASDTSEKWFTGATPEGERWVSSAFTEASFTHGNWLDVIAGLRYDWYQLEGDGRMFSGTINNPPGVRPSQTAIYTSFDVKRHAGAFAPKLTVSITPYEWLQTYVSYGEGLRPPAITESLLWGAHVGNMFFYFPSPGLEEERSRNMETGVNLNWGSLLQDNDFLGVKAAWFDTNVENYMVQAAIMTPVDQAQPVGFSGFSFVNLTDEVRFRGLELQGDYESHRFTASISYTRMLMDLGEATYNPFPLGSLYGYPSTVFGQAGWGGVWYVLPPSQRVVASAGVKFFDQKLELGTRYRFERPSKNAAGPGWVSDSALSSWQNLDLWASYELSKAITLRISANNLRNTYYTEMNGGSYQVGPGRTLIGGVSLKF